jgi:hypothetical protein
MPHVFREGRPSFKVKRRRIILTYRISELNKLEMRGVFRQIRHDCSVNGYGGFCDLNEEFAFWTDTRNKQPSKVRPCPPDLHPTRCSEKTKDIPRGPCYAGPSLNLEDAHPHVEDDTAQDHYELLRLMDEILYHLTWVTCRKWEEWDGSEMRARWEWDENATPRTRTGPPPVWVISESTLQTWTPTFGICFESTLRTWTPTQVSQNYELFWTRRIW